MIQVQKDILLKYLCMALPYEVICRCRDTFDGCEVDNVLHPDDITDMFRHRRIDIKPYLRPMSSMTEEEEKEYASLLDDNGWGINEELMVRCINWLLAHHFDFMGLIPINAAIDCTDLEIYKD